MVKVADLCILKSVSYEIWKKGKDSLDKFKDVQL